ncbi:MAG TPA: RluA family pseudouridine synthase [Gaiellaceae bacterium]|jgi:23S rRNA pseudouridine1911/1915/1917 synthase
MSEISETAVLIVEREAAGERLDRYLASHLGSRAAGARAVDRGALVDGRTRPRSHRLEGGERVELPPEDEPVPVEPAGPPLRVAWQDEHLAVVDKPAGLVVHPGAGRATGTMVDLLVGIAAGGEEDRPGIVHRLDRDTSGLLVVARSEEAHRRLSALVKARELERVYLALVRGRPASRAGRIEAPIGRDRDDPTRFSLDTDTPREAITHFEVIETHGEHSLLRVRLETGRTHQIRVHLRAVGLPVIGDPVYGIRDPALGRQFLHATHLGFTHPFTGEPVDADSPLPPELAAYLGALG